MSHLSPVAHLFKDPTITAVKPADQKKATITEEQVMGVLKGTESKLFQVTKAATWDKGICAKIALIVILPLTLLAAAFLKVVDAIRNKINTYQHKDFLSLEQALVNQRARVALDPSKMPALTPAQELEMAQNKTVYDKLLNSAVVMTLEKAGAKTYADQKVAVEALANDVKAKELAKHGVQERADKLHDDVVEAFHMHLVDQFVAAQTVGSVTTAKLAEFMAHFEGVSDAEKARLETKTFDQLQKKLMGKEGKEIDAEIEAMGTPKSLMAEVTTVVSATKEEKNKLEARYRVLTGFSFGKLTGDCKEESAIDVAEKQMANTRKHYDKLDAKFDQAELPKGVQKALDKMTVEGDTLKCRKTIEDTSRPMTEEETEATQSAIDKLQGKDKDKDKDKDAARAWVVASVKLLEAVSNVEKLRAELTALEKDGTTTIDNKEVRGIPFVRAELEAVKDMEPKDMIKNSSLDVVKRAQANVDKRIAMLEMLKHNATHHSSDAAQAEKTAEMQEAAKDLNKAMSSLITAQTNMQAAQAPLASLVKAGIEFDVAREARADTKVALLRLQHAGAKVLELVQLALGALSSQDRDSMLQEACEKTGCEEATAHENLTVFVPALSAVIDSALEIRRFQVNVMTPALAAHMQSAIGA